MRIDIYRTLASIFSGVCVAFTVLVGSAQATILYWNPDGTASQGGNGLWSDSGKTWSSSATGAQVDGTALVTWADGDVACFCAGPSTQTTSPGSFHIIMTGPINCGGIVNGDAGPPGCTVNIAYEGGSLNIPSGPVVFDIGGSDYAVTSTTIGVPINGAGSLNATGNGLLVLEGTNTYTGTTTINAGVLALEGRGSISNSPLICIASDAEFDVSSLSGTFTLANGQSLMASGFAAILNGPASGGIVSMGKQPIILNYTPSTFNGDSSDLCLYVTQGSLSLDGNAFSVTNMSGTPLGVGTYTLIEQANGNINILGYPVFPVRVYGAGVIAGATASITVSGGLLNLVVSHHDQPSFSGLTPSQSAAAGSSITLSGTLSGPGPTYPALGESVSASIGGRNQSTTIDDATGDFNFVFSLAGVAGSATPYTILYSYAGDSSLATAEDSSTSVTVRSIVMFSELTASQTIASGISNITLTGNLGGSDGFGPLFPGTGQTITVTINGDSQSTATSDIVGDFSIDYSLSGIQASATPYTISYSYAGDNSLEGTTNATTTLTVNSSALSATSFSDVSPSQAVPYGSTVGLSGTVSTLNAAATNYPAMGEGVTVTLLYGSSNPSLVSTIGDTTGDFSCVLNISGIPASPTPYTVNFSYGGDSTLAGAVAETTVTVTPALLTVTADNQSRIFGSTNPVFTASFSNFANGETLATSDVVGSPMLTTSATNFSPVGVYTISNSIGTLTSTNYTFNFVDGNLVVTSAASSNAVRSSANPSQAGAPVTFTVTLEALPPSQAVPEGSVQFSIDSTNFGEAVTVTNGTASVVDSSLTPGNHTIEADYAGTTNIFGSTNTFIESINAQAIAPPLNIMLAASNTVIVSWPSPSTGFIIQENTSLAATNWVASVETVVDNGTTRSISVTPQAVSFYYRLISP
jgi:autotransporter-associated beta strand protein